MDTIRVSSKQLQITLQSTPPQHSTKGFCAVMGVFDGLHLGHQHLLKQAQHEASERHLQLMLITFDPSPRAYFTGNIQEPILSPLNVKAQLCEQMGIECMVVLPFEPLLIGLNAQTFITKILHQLLNVDTFIVGYDHRFGYNRDEGFDEYRTYGAACGMTMLPAKVLRTEKREIYSSTLIKKRLSQGLINQANRLLGYDYLFTGFIIHGRQLGRTIGYPTANIRLDHSNQLLPCNGVYAAQMLIGEQWYNGMLNIGYNPTVSNRTDALSIEFHIFDFIDNLYGSRVQVRIQKFIRKEQRFDSLKELKEQLKTDERNIRMLQKGHLSR